MKTSKYNTRIIVSSICLLALGVFCFSVEHIYHHSYFLQNIQLGATNPSINHICGTDLLGRDILARILYGGKISLTIGAAATFTALIIGTIYGTISGFFGGITDMLMMRFVDILYPMPLTLVVILFMAFFGNNLYVLFMSIGMIEWLTPARIIRAHVKNLKTKEFILASKTLGQSTIKILTKHILPNTLDTIIVYATLTMPSMMLLESFLSFLGIGVRPPRSSWGTLMSDGAKIMTIHPWQLIFTSLFFISTLLLLNLLGNALRDKFDPIKK